MKIDWNLVLDQLLFLDKKESRNIDGLNNLTIDTLHGSVYGLNYRYQSLHEVLSDVLKRKNIINYSISRIKKLIPYRNFSFKKRKPERCRIGVGTYRWDYNPKLIEYAIRMGVSLIDTAEGYGYGKVEKELGTLLQNYKCSKVNVFTKIRRDHMSHNAITRAMDRSINHLHIKPHIQLHYPNDKYPNAITFLSDYNKRGKIKSIGLGNCSVDMIEQSQRMINASGGIINSVQLPFSLLNFRIKKTVIKYCNARGILVIAYSPLGQDFKKLNSDFLKQIAKKYDAASSQIALSWILSHKGVLPIPQTNNINHLKENFGANNLHISKAHKKALQDYYAINQ